MQKVRKVVVDAKVGKKQDCVGDGADARFAAAGARKLAQSAAAIPTNIVKQHHWLLRTEIGIQQRKHLALEAIAVMLLVT